MTKQELRERVIDVLSPTSLLSPENQAVLVDMVFAEIGKTHALVSRDWLEAHPWVADGLPQPGDLDAFEEAKQMELIALAIVAVLGGAGCAIRWRVGR